jgi:hypothetical protein
MDFREIEPYKNVQNCTSQIQHKLPVVHMGLFPSLILKLLQKNPIKGLPYERITIPT